MDLTLTLSADQVAAHQTLYATRQAAALAANPKVAFPDFTTWLTFLLMMSVDGVTKQQSAIADAAVLAKFSALPAPDKATVTAAIDSAFSKM